ncbi:hypothetical protein ES703_95283 [subsurface metagenome]
MAISRAEISNIGKEAAENVVARRGDICKCVDWFLVATTAAEALEHNATVSGMAKNLHENLKEIIPEKQLEDLEFRHTLLQGYILENFAEMALAGSMGSIRDKCDVDISDVKELADKGFEAISRRDSTIATESFTKVKLELLKLAGKICGEEESNPARVHFDRADITSAIEAAKRLKSDRDLYIFATHLGYTIDKRPPPGMQQYVIVHTDGSTETIKPGGESNPVAKELWEMTLEQYALEKGARPAWVKAGYGETYRTHKRAVERAISEGKPVPPEVLADYPALLKGAK